MSATARPYHHGNLREALLEAAERALETTGAADLSLRELAREVGVSHAAPRRHFADRQALLDALALNGFLQLGATLDAALATAPPADFAARMHALARAYVGFATTRPALVALMFASKHAAGASPELAQAAEGAFAPALAVIVDGQASGAVVAGDPERLAKIAFALLQGLVALINNDLLDEKIPPGELLDDAAQRLLLGFAPR